MTVVDASVAVKWVVPEAGSAPAADLLAQDLIAPAHWLSEAANALWAKHRRRQLSAAEVSDRVAELLTAPVLAIPLPELLPAATAMALELEHPVYDCLYLAAAQLRDRTVVTADRRFVERVRGHPYLGARIRLLGEGS